MKSIYPLCHTVFPFFLKRAIAFFILVFFAVSLKAQTPISGVVNTYHKVIDTVPSKACVLVDNTTGLAHGDMVLLVQMKGASINTAAASSLFGDVTNLNEAGNYEVATICAVIDDSVFFFHNLINDYDPSDKVQLVKFAEYFSAEVVDTVKASSWDSVSGKGGVIAIRVDETLILSAPIYGDSSGYKGGAFLLHGGNCPVGSQWAYDPTLFNSFGHGAYKGEGVVGDLTIAISGGKGAPANGGGGGNNHNYSGAGGGNLRTGGNGGGNSSSVSLSCKVAGNFGRGGKGLNSYGGSKIFMGGGGGAGHGNGGVFTIGGGNGGALVFIWAETLIGNGQEITANGGVGGQSLGDGAGGGGAGGTIIMNVTTYSGSLTITANGGNGGQSNDDLLSNRCFGGGGGGAGGVIYFTGAKPIAPVTVEVDGGLEGGEINRHAGCLTAIPGTNGTVGLDSAMYAFTRSTDPAGYCLLLLPSKLISFSAGLVSSKVSLNWRVLYPELVSEFIVEKRTAANTWTTITSTQAIPGIEQYSTLDNDLLPGNNFYRLKVVEKNNSSYYSDTRLIIFDPASSTFNIYPNPAHKAFTITGDFNSPVNMQLLDLSGRLILQKQLLTDRTEIRLPELGTGIYMIRIGQSVKKLVIR